MRFRCKQCSAINVMNQAQPGSTIKCGKCAAVLTVPEHAASPNVVFGDFVIIDVWNKHSHETDFIAEQISTQRRCLLKIPAQPIQNDKKVLQRYIARIRKIASFSHPFHADIITMGKDNDLVFVVTQLPQGESLKKHLTEQGTFLWNDALRFIGETAEVLHHAYQKTGLAHLNLKPDYLFLDPYGHVTVTDIGFAAFKIDEDDEKIIGTPQYISPERIVGLEGDFRSDLYSLGIIAFMMLTGEMPYPGSSGQEFIQHHLNTTPAKVRQRNPKLPEFLDHIIDRMLQKNPEQRYQTWAELNVDLLRASQPSRETSSSQRKTDITETVKETKDASAESEPLKPGTLKVRIEGDSRVSLLQPTQHDPAKSSNSIVPTPEEGVKVKPPVNQDDEDDVIIIEDESSEEVIEIVDDADDSIDRLLNTPITAQIPSAAAIKRAPKKSEPMVLPAIQPEGEVVPVIPVAPENFNNDDDVEIIEPPPVQVQPAQEAAIPVIPIQPPPEDAVDEDETAEAPEEAPAAPARKQGRATKAGLSSSTLRKKKKKFRTRAGMKTQTRLR